MAGIVDVHKNLNKGGWSILQNGVLVAHRHWVLMSGVTWVVQPAGPSRVRSKGHRDVHAFARGVVLTAFHGTLPNEQNLDSLSEVTYNPFHNDTFVYRDTGKPVEYSPWAVFTRMPGASAPATATKDKAYAPK